MTNITRRQSGCSGGIVTVSHRIGVVMLLLLLWTQVAVQLSRTTAFVIRSPHCYQLERRSCLVTRKQSCLPIQYNLKSPQQLLVVGWTSTRSYRASSAEENIESTTENSNNHVEDAVAEVTGQEINELVIANEESKEQEEQEQEDPELIALKNEIIKMEGLLKEKRRQLAITSDQADEYTKTGYARKVAEMENMRRARSMLQSSNRYSATADVLVEFLPVLDELDRLREKHGNDEFGKLYNALPDNMRSAFTSMGVSDFTTAVGESIDRSRMEVIESEYSSVLPANTVLRPISVGLDLEGNIVRKAACVASLGPEPVLEEVESTESQSADDVKAETE